ncbi:MAG: adenylate/guanylate cyclase domain-containing protein [Treponema sp.]|nr:adenylate/guanylate cyclase domain-containing protein [Treponema sp.]
MNSKAPGSNENLTDYGNFIKSSARPSKTDFHRQSAPSSSPAPKTKTKVQTKQPGKTVKPQTSKSARVNSQKVKSPIGRKLIVIISLVIIIALGGVTYLVSYFTTQDVRISAEENNLVINSRTAGDTESRIENISSSIGMLLDLLKTTNNNEAEIKSVEALFFDHNQDIMAVYFPSKDRILLNTAFLISHRITPDTTSAYFAQETDSIKKASDGTFELKNSSPFFNVPSMAIFEPLSVNGKNTAVCILWNTEDLSENFGNGSVNQSILVNNDGDILVHGDISFMMDGSSENKNPIVLEMQKSTQNNSQITYKDADEEEYIGAFRKLKIGNGAVITTVKTAVILEGVRTTTRRNLYITVAILFIAIMIIYLFSKTLSVPLRQLTAIVNEINNGNFNTELFSLLKEDGKDEISVLAKSTKNERQILNTFTTLTNRGVTEAIIKKQIDFKPHLKDITIFFSDIRGFTAISDGFKKRFGGQSAGEIINFLNDYMSRMVMCIQLTGGTVDKFEGDAIMACWGVLRNDSMDWEELPYSSPVRAQKQFIHDHYVCRDALSAITSCIAMRYALMKYNKDAEAFTAAHAHNPKAQYKPHIKIGAGLNSGRATVGFLGSKQKMEFTSIGDAVNFASRAESSNKPCGTDILITEDTYNLLSPKYIRCAKNNYQIAPENRQNEVIVEQIPVEFDVKGKGKQHFYGVVNMPNFDIQAFFSRGDPKFQIDMDCARAAGRNGPKSLTEVRKLLGIDEPDFMKVDLNAEENKIQVATN